MFNSAGVLVACGLGHPRHCDRLRTSDLETVIIEHPMVYPRGQTPDANAIVKLAINAGEWGGRFEAFAKIEYVLPVTWKGSVPKGIHHARVWAKLLDQETQVIDDAITPAKHPRMMRRAADVISVQPYKKPAIPASKLHNMLDAVGLGLWKIGR